MPRHKGYRGVVGPILIDDDDDDAFLTKQQGIERGLETHLANVIDLTSDYVVPTAAPQRPPAERILDSYQCPDGAVLLPGMALQLRHPRGQFDAKYFRIVRIVSLSPKTEPVLRGWLYTRTRTLGGRLPKKLNEVCLVADIDNADPRPWEEQALVDMQAKDLHRVREMRTTNAPLPEFRDEKIVQKHGATHEFFEKHAALVCRFRFLRYFNGREMVKKDKPYQWAICRISEREADEKYRVSTAQVVKSWRGRRRVGGSHVPAGSMVGNSPTTGLLLPGQTYSTADMFAGAGGVSRGMTLAGAHVVYAVDNWDPAVASLGHNFKSTDVYCRDITDFATRGSLEKVDILHLSPPCQTWSPAHTNPGKNDETNEAALLACGHLVQKCKPRLFTLEQTFGLVFDKNEDFFNALILSFTDHGYSVRWQVINLATYGLPQPRRRLIIIGAGPGETLPDFPPPTHAKDGIGGLKPFVTVRQALAPLAHGHVYGEDDRVYEFKEKKPAWDPDTLSNTITCDGGKNNYHWDGDRDFTIQEFALLQGFPVVHRFVGTKTDRKKQIGNAFPPSVVKVLYSHLIKWLDYQDGIRGRLPPPPPPPTVVCLDADPIDVDRLDMERSTGEETHKVIVDLQDDDIMVLDSDESIHTGDSSGTETARGTPTPASSLYSSPREKVTPGGIRTFTPPASLSPLLSRSKATRHMSMTRRESKMTYRSMSLQHTREGSGFRDDPVEVSD